MKKSLAQKILRILAGVVAGLVLLGLVTGIWFYAQLRASLPQLDGAANLPGLTAAVTIERDALGTPTIRGGNRADVTRALGYLHAQDRFFQMDLLRRRAAGELAELVGPAAVPADQTARLHGFRSVAQRALALDTPANRSLVEAYTAGVNAGLAALRQKPFEYVVLRTAPAPWRAEDSYLLGASMAFDLQDPLGRYERSLATLRDVLGPQALAFFAPEFAPDDAALDGSTGQLAPIPSAKAIDLRRRTMLAAREITPVADPLLPGSNSFALAGARTASGAALLANDMHLDLRVPTPWYRATLIWSAAGTEHRVTGVTLPGAPCVIAGSNGHVAWGFTASYADTSDVIIVEPNIIDRSLYKYRDTNLELTTRDEIINVRGGDPVTFTVSSTQWGPIIGPGPQNRLLAYRWVLHDPAATNYDLLDLETAANVDEAIAVAHRAGIPAQNIVIADTAGQIAWTIAGRLPRRIGFTGRLPTTWAYGDRAWDGLLPVGEVPVIRQPAAGALWTANTRVLGGEAYARLGDGGYAAPARGAQIRDGLATLQQATPRDLLALQLDDRALFLDRWQKLLLQVLTPEVVAQQKSRAELRRLVENWTPRASVDSVGYRLVRTFRFQTAELALGSIFESCLEENDQFKWRRFHYEQPLWTLLHEKPAHLLDPKFTTWDELIVAAVDATITTTEADAGSLARATWGRANTAHIRHPLGRVLPGWLTGWLSLPADQLAGDDHMPRVQSPDFGASERFVVSPGREAEGIMHLPGGQSGHPLSPYFRAGHDAWVKGDPTPFLPGPAQHTLILNP